MINRLIITILIGFIGISLLGQETKDEYQPFMKDGVEYKTNGKDTICIVDLMPEFIGGREKLVEFIRNNMKYPKKARKDKIEGKVIIRFTIDKTGEVRDIVIISGVREDLDNEAIRIISKMPSWKPGEQHGTPIPVSFNLPIHFQLN